MAPAIVSLISAFLQCRGINTTLASDRAFKDSAGCNQVKLKETCICTSQDNSFTILNQTAATAGQEEILFRFYQVIKLNSLFNCEDIRKHGYFHHIREPHNLECSSKLPHGNILAKLPCYSRCNGGIYRNLGFLEQVYHRQELNFVSESAKITGCHTFTAIKALVVLNNCFLCSAIESGLIFGTDAILLLTIFTRPVIWL